MKRSLRYFFSITTFIAGSSSASVETDLEQYIPQSSKFLASTTRKISNNNYIFIKYLDEKSGRIEKVIVNNQGEKISLTEDSRGNPPLIDTDLTIALYEAGDNKNKQFKVNVALNTPASKEDIALSSSSLISDKDTGLVIRKNGSIISPELLSTDLNKLQKNLADKRKIRDETNRSIATSLITQHGWNDSNELLAQVKEGRATLTLTLSKEEINRLVTESRNLIQGVELYIEPKDDIAGAMLNTLINPHAINYPERRGAGVGIYMTESGCPNAGHITGYTRLAGPHTSHSENVSAILRAVSPDSHIYCRGGAVLPTTADLNGYGSNPPIHIATRSNGNASSHDYAILDRDWENLVYDSRIVHFNAAGNEGLSGNQISSPGKGLNALAIGAYDDANNTIANFSSGQNPSIGNQKPEYSAPGVNITAGGHTMSGTSMATPHVAAFTADILSDWLKYQPAATKAYMMATSRKSIAGGFDKVGMGGPDFLDTYTAYDNHWWMGPNNAFQGFDAGDIIPNNGFIERTFSLAASSNSVRVVFAWLSRGDFTYQNRFAAQPIGMDLDILVYNPNGVLVGSSTSFNDSYESVEFIPTVRGTYVVKIQRTTNQDINSGFFAGLSINR